MDGWIKKCGIYTQNSAIKGIMSFLGKQMILEFILLSEIVQI
jgi:hypothetical protein